jgi:hypothetical protein
VFFSLPFFRHLAYEYFLRAHQGLAGFLLYATWRHLPSDRLLPRLCIYVSLGLFTLTLFLQVIFLHSHLAFISCDSMDEDGDKREDVENAVMVRVVLSRPMKLDAGQYIILWMPT